jgi:hypothetical protein
VSDTIDRYTRNKQVELAASIKNKAKVYLDTRFWIIAREVTEGIQTGPAEVELVDVLRQGVGSGALISPISESVFLEVGKQSGSHRIAMARLIDELSNGVTLISVKERIATEVAHFLHRPLPNVTLYPMSDLVWTKLCYVLGYVHPHSSKLSPADELRLQKAFVDKMWTIPLAEWFEMIGDQKGPEEPFEKLAANLNLGNAMHAV